jgi:hypothetical protein
MDKGAYRPSRVIPFLLLGGIIGTAGTGTVLLAKDQETTSLAPIALDLPDITPAAIPLVQNERVQQLISMGEAFASPVRWQAREYSIRYASVTSDAGQALQDVVPEHAHNNSYHFHF